MTVLSFRSTFAAVSFFAALGGCAMEAASERDFLEGADVEPRRDLFEADTRSTLRYARADLFATSREYLRERRDGDYDYLSDPFVTIQEPPPEVGLCPDASFYGQPRVRWGASVVLVGEDLVLTARHTMPNAGVCADRALILDHAIATPPGSSDVPAIVSADRVYFCAEIVANGHPSSDPDPTNDGDWALFRLDRPVDFDHRPIPIRRGGPPLVQADAIIAGHPHRLPLKFEIATVTTAPSYVFGRGHVTPGSSGSMVVDTGSGRLVGVVSEGLVQRVFDPEQNCYRECVSDGCYQSYAGISVGLAASSVPHIGLDATPADSILHYGPPGGPFTQPSVDYTLAAGDAGRTVEVAVSTEGEDLLIVGLRTSGALAIPPGRSVPMNVALVERASALPLGAYDAAVRLVERVYSTSDARAHRVLVGVQGFGVQTQPAPPVLSYAVSNRYDVVQEVVVGVPTWLRLDGAGQRLSVSLPPVWSRAPVPAFTVDRNPAVPAPPGGTEATIEIFSGGRSRWHTERRRVLWDGARIVPLD
jgi:hypothetical protein